MFKVIKPHKNWGQKPWRKKFPKVNKGVPGVSPEETVLLLSYPIIIFWMEILLENIATKEKVTKNIFCIGVEYTQSVQPNISVPLIFWHLSLVLGTS